MNRATKLTIATFGVVAALAGAEHGIGAVLQGNRAPEGLVFLSWPDSPFFRILGGEPAMSLIPNLLVTGILAILVSLIVLVWAVRFVERRDGGPVLILLSVVWLLVGGGFGPPVLGTILGLGALAARRPERVRARFPACAGLPGGSGRGCSAAACLPGCCWFRAATYSTISWA